MNKVEIFNRVNRARSGLPKYPHPVIANKMIERVGELSLVNAFVKAYPMYSRNTVNNLIKLSFVAEGSRILDDFEVFCMRVKDGEVFEWEEKPKQQ